MFSFRHRADNVTLCITSPVLTSSGFPFVLYTLRAMENLPSAEVTVQSAGNTGFGINNILGLSAQLPLTPCKMFGQEPLRCASHMHLLSHFLWFASQTQGFQSNASYCYLLALSTGSSHYNYTCNTQCKGGSIPVGQVCGAGY